MSAVTKNLIPQLVPPAPQPGPKLFLNDSISLNEARQLSQFVPVIVLVPASSGEDKVTVLQTGNNSLGVTSAASKLLEFFGTAMTELRAKSPESDVVFSDVTVNFSSMEATRKDKPVVLTALEFKILKYLIQNARRVISRAELLNEVWGYENYPSTRTVDNHILRLRQKLERVPSQPVHFRTVHSAGYKFLP